SPPPAAHGRSCPQSTPAQRNRRSQGVEERNGQTRTRKGKVGCGFGAGHSTVAEAPPLAGWPPARLPGAWRLPHWFTPATPAPAEPVASTVPNYLDGTAAARRRPPVTFPTCASGGRPAHRNRRAGALGPSPVRPGRTDSAERKDHRRRSAAKWPRFLLPAENQGS